MRALSDDRSAPAPSEQLTLLAPSEAPAVRGLDAEPDAEPGAERLLLVPEQQRPAPSGPHPSGRRQADEEVTLSPEQNAAVARRHEPLLLSAGAGSGKTRVLVERFVAAVLEDQMAPSKILAITFTERAAGELRERIRARFLQLGRRETARELERAFVGTFHGFCASVLRAHAWRAGLEGDFAILDEGSARWLRGRAFEQAMRELVAGDREEAVGLLAAYGPERARSIVSSLYAALRSRGQVRPRLPLRLSPMRCGAHEAEISAALAGGVGGEGPIDEEAWRACALLDELLDGFGRAYEQLKRERGALDFDDLELRAGGLLQQSADVRASWSERFELLMVDEFQDTNARQLAILTALERGNLFTVGDELQSIYRFRHADVGLFTERRAALASSGGTLQLTHNFRSRAALLAAVNAVFSAQMGAGYTPLVAARGDAEPEGEEGAGGGCEEAAAARVELLLCSKRGWELQSASAHARAPAWRLAEARMLARRVAELIEGGDARAGEVAVLLRSLSDLDCYEGALRERGLSTAASGSSFWHSQPVGDLLAYLRALANPLDELALYSVLASPMVGISSDGLALLARAVRVVAHPQGHTRAGAGKRGSLWGLLQSGAAEVADVLSPADRTAALGFCRRLERERAALSRRPLSRVLERAIGASGYCEHLLELDDAQRGLANVHKLLRLAREFEAREGRKLRGFLEHAAAQQREPGGAEPDGVATATDADAVQLMSIHAAKGLEFPVVCLADLGRAPIESVEDVLVEGQRLGLRVATLDGARPRAALEFEQLREEQLDAQAQEEQRIFYVAMTRARERLLLSGAVDFERWPAVRRGAPPISWIAPALAPELPQLAAQHIACGRHVHDALLGGTLEGTAGERPRVRCRLLARAVEGLPGDERQAGAREGGEGAPAQAPARGELPRDPDVSRSPIRAARLQPPSPPACARSGAPPRVADPLKVVSSLSYTGLSELERCGYRFYLERVLGLSESAPPPPRGRLDSGARAQALDARARGQLVHRVLQSINFARLTPISEDGVEGAARELGLRASKREVLEVAELLRGALVSGSPGARRERHAQEPRTEGIDRELLLERLARAPRVHREHPFTFALVPHQALISGVIDVLAREPDGGCLVVDYKTDSVERDIDPAQLVERKYAAQRLIYALAVLRDGAPSVQVVHWFLHAPHRCVSAQYDAAEQAELERRLRERLERARSHGFAVSEHPHRALCASCPGRATLCSWDEEQTMRQGPEQTVRKSRARTPRETSEQTVRESREQELREARERALEAGAS